jgi:hypothetical protein
MLLVSTLANRISELKELGLTEVSVVGNWLVCRVMLLKNQVHPGWEYSSTEDLTRETNDNLSATKMMELLPEVFQNIDKWPTPEHVRTYHLRVARDLVRQC